VFKFVGSQASEAKRRNFKPIEIGEGGHDYEEQSNICITYRSKNGVKPFDRAAQATGLINEAKCTQVAQQSIVRFS
jgi:hypothetical protein